MRRENFCRGAQRGGEGRKGGGRRRGIEAVTEILPRKSPSLPPPRFPKECAATEATKSVARAKGKEGSGGRAETRPRPKSQIVFAVVRRVRYKSAGRGDRRIPPSRGSKDRANKKTPHLYGAGFDNTISGLNGRFPPQNGDVPLSLLMYLLPPSPFRFCPHLFPP